jgi:glycosyltransferase involved in cell wall biosynthesis
VPVVAATGSCLEEAGGKGGLYIDPKEVNAFAQTLTALWHDEPLRKTLIMEGQKHVRQFAAGKIAKELTEIYASL